LSVASYATAETSDDSDAEDLPPPFTVRHSKDRGLALFTTRRVTAGALLFSESPLISLSQTLESDYEAVEAAFAVLSKRDQKAYLALYDAQKSRMSQVVSIYYSNCYNKDFYSDDGGSCISPLGSRINHSCLPNVCFSYIPPSGGYPKGQVRFHATRNIPAGKEILCCYEKHTFMAREQRKQRLMLDYGFKCDCEACVPKTDFWEKSDERRLSMEKLVKATKRAEKEWERAHEDDALSEQNTAVCERAIESLVKLEGLLSKEGLVYTPLANAYRGLAKWAGRAGRDGEVRMWLRKELKVCETCFGKDTERCVVLRRELLRLNGEEREDTAR
jgi:SET domain